MRVKDLGQVYTPTYIVDFMLDEIGYIKGNIINRKIIEPSAGDGNFVVQIYRRYLKEIKRESRLTRAKILSVIENIFAIELDPLQYSILLKNITNEIYNHINEKTITPKELESALKKNILNRNTLKQKFNFKFDYIIGNPPYVRLHNLEKSDLEYMRSNFISMEKGSVDLYYAFFEWGILNLKDNGLMSFITPNNFLNNSSAKSLRKILKGNIKSIYNFQSEQIFENASTYNSISVLSKGHKNTESFLPTTVNNRVVKGRPREIFHLKDKLIISEGNWIRGFLEEEKPQLNFKNGLATLCDSLFITSNFKNNKDGTYLFNGERIEESLIRPIVKISTSFNSDKKRVAIFPYKIIDDKIIGLTKNELKQFPLAEKYFNKNSFTLKSRSLDSHAEWFHYGRSQAINSITVNKLILKTLVKNKVEYNFIPKGTLVYSGLYSEYKNKSVAKEFMDSENLYKYIREVGFDKRGEYKTITSSLLKELWENGK